MKNLKVKITFIEPILGTAPNDKEIYENFIGSKAPDASTIEDEVAALGTDAVVEKGMTVFPKNVEGSPILYDYQVKGFFKDSCGMLARVGGKSKAVNESGKLKAYKKIIDGLIFVQPREIPLISSEPMQICQRPLRAQTMQGERVALAMSEEMPAGTTAVFDIICLSDEHEAAVREWLDYGILRGIGQWRNSGKGRFSYEVLEE